jgi:hypothetical protein
VVLIDWVSTPTVVVDDRVLDSIEGILLFLLPLERDGRLGLNKTIMKSMKKDLKKRRNSMTTAGIHCQHGLIYA